MLRLLCAILFAIALTAIPPCVVTQFAGPAKAETATTGGDGKAAKAGKKTKKTKKKTKKKRPLTKGQKAARERQKKCGAEWRALKKAGKIEKGMTWPKYWSRCNTRLKGKKS